MEDVTKQKRESRVLAFVIVSLILAGAIVLALVFGRDRGPGDVAAEVGHASLEVPLVEVAAEMIAGFDDFSLAVTNGDHVVYVGKFVAKRTSAVNGRVRVNFDATAYEPRSAGRWNVSVLIEFSLVGDGARIRGKDIAVRRIHIYDLPKTVGNDELENNLDVVSIVKRRIRPSKAIVSDSEKIVDLKLTTDDAVKISWENAK